MKPHPFHLTRQHLARVFVAAGTLIGALSLSSVPATHADAADGSIDTTFTAGQRGANGTIRAIAFTSDEKIYIAGDFTTYNGFTVNGLARLNPNGAPDLLFNFQNAGFGGSGLSITSISVDSSGKIYATGKFTSYNGTNLGTNNQDNVIRINTDGSQDTTFVAPSFINTASNANLQVPMSLVKSIGDIVYVSGNFDDVKPQGGSTIALNGLVALTPTGAIESNFGTNARLRLGTASAKAYDILSVPSSTDIYVTGPFTVVNSATALGIARLKNDGTRSADYANSGTAPAVGPTGSITPMESMALQPDGKLLLSGGFTKFNDVATAKGLVRVNPDATLDTSFTSPSSDLVSSSVAVDSYGRIYVAGGIGTAFGTSTSRAIVRLKSDGTVDPSFDLVGAPTGYENKVAISPAGKVFLYGNMTKIGTTDVDRLVRITTSAPVAATTTTVAATIAPTTTPNTGTVTASAPGQPTEIKVKVVGTKATVSWKAPTSGSTPTSYTAVAAPAGVVKKSVNAANVSLSCTATAPTTSCTISGLQIGMKYGFGVSASNGTTIGTTSYLATPVSVVAPAKKLPATGSSQMWILLSAATLLMLSGVALRRVRAA